MAYTIIATWDFRGADSAATKRASRIGSFTLSENGTPTYNTDGVTFDAAGEGLSIPSVGAGLRPTEPFWCMISFRRLGVAGADYSNYAGWAANNVVAAPFVVHQINADNSGNVRYLINSAGTFTAAAATPALANNTDVAYTFVKRSTTADLYDGSTSIASITSVSAVTYYATSEFGIGDMAGLGRNSNMRANWLIVGTGDITTGEMTTIQGAPNTYLYPSATTFFRPYFITG
jgi:hypothetical protein